MQARLDSPHPITVSAREAAKLLGVSERTVWTYAHAGQLASVRIGTRRLFRPRDLEAFAERNLVNRESGVER